MEALAAFVAEKNVKLFTKHKVFTEAEIHSRYEVLLENYSKTINIEALTVLEMVKKDILPAVNAYCKDLSKTAVAKKAVSATISTEFEEALLAKISGLAASLYKKTVDLDAALLAVKDYDARKPRRIITTAPSSAMQEVWAVADELEMLVGENTPFPTFGELLFSV